MKSTSLVRPVVPAAAAEKYFTQARRARAARPCAPGVWLSLLRTAPVRGLVMFGFWALALPAQAGFTNQATPNIAGVYNSSVAWGDYDNDGDLDFALTGLDAGDIPLSRILSNQGGGAFANSGITLPGVYSSALAWGDYDNDGNLDLLLAGATSLTYPYAPICRLYRNRGDGSFGYGGTALPGVYAGAVAWADYDQDGDLDFVLTGWSDAGRISRIYRNDGGGAFVDSGLGLAAVNYSSVAWGDYDNDGDLDLLLSGSSSGGRITRLYRNNGGGSFSDSGIPLTGLTTGCVAWGDYDNDGDLDLFLTGSTGTGRVSQVYTNHGTGLLTDSGIALAGLASSAAAWGDYDNDGDLDLFLMGDGGSGPLSLLYTNQGLGSFADSGTVLPGLASGSVAWGDYDNSGQIDLLLTGFDTNYSAAAYLGRNTETTTNAAPYALAGLTTRLSGRDVTLSWNVGSDDHTSPSGLHYNLRLGTASKGVDRVSPMADATNGFRRVVRMGNGARTNTWTVKGLPDGTYFWSVQAIDTSFAGGGFAGEAGFTVPSNPPTDIGLSPGQVNEGQPAGTTVGKLTASDLNADDGHSFALVPGAGDADNTAFTVAGDELQTAAVFDFETRNSYRIRLRATDPAGLYTEKALMVAVVDFNEPPQARCQDVTVVAGANGTAPASIDNGSSDPDAGDAIAVRQSPPGPYPAGANLVTLTVTDSRGASDSCPATVTVRDATPPRISCPSSLTLDVPPGQCAAVLSYYSAVTASDNCDPAPAISSVPPAGTPLSVGLTPVIVTATDASGNSDSCTFTVAVYPEGAEVAGVEWTEREIVPAPEPRAWRSVAGSASGVVLAAVYNGRLHVSRDYGATWTERENSRSWQSVACSTAGAKLAAVVHGGQIFTSADSGTNWTARENNRSWSGVASSADGTKLVAVVYGGHIYTSTNSGESWMARDAARGWSSVACSADAGTLVAAVKGGQIYTSADSGETWIPRGDSLEPLQWSSVACSSGGDFMVAAVTGGQLYTSRDYGVTWAARATNREWSSVACSQYNLILAADKGSEPSAGRLFTSTDLGQTWTECATDRAWSAVAVAPGSDLAFAAVDGGHIHSSWDGGATWEIAAITRLWRSVASSADGTKLVAVANGAQIYLSADSGTNWIARASARAWYSIASSADGAKLVAAVNGGQIYTSADSGETWTPRENTRQWHCVASSADGTKLVAAAYGGRLYTSTDSGAMWTPRESNRNWSRVAASADGIKLVATVYGGFIYTSGDSGTNWMPREDNRYWSGVASSAEGTKLVAQDINDGRMYTSANSGLNWTACETNRNWSGVAASADGTKLVATVYRGSIYTSSDSGANWAPRQSNRYWCGVASSSDGGRLVAAAYGGRIYTSVPTRMEPQPPAILGATNQVVGATTQAGAVVTFSVTATNHCQPNVLVTCTPPSGSTFPFGTNTVVCEAVDAFGVRVTNTFTVAVVERPEQGGWGQALAFDGIDDQASVASIVLTHRPLTIELWARRASAGTADAMVGQGDGSPGQGLFLTFLQDSRVAFSFSAGELQTTGSYEDSGWHHWAATYDPAAGRRLYRDGFLVAADTDTDPYSGTGPLLVGGIPWLADAAFDGSLDDLRIWNYARSAEQIQTDMLHPLTGLVPGLVAYWNFNDDAGGTIQDVTLNGHDGTLVNGPARPDSTVPPWGYALSFGRTNDFVQSSQSIDLANQSFTIEAWAKRSRSGQWDMIVGQGRVESQKALGFGFRDTDEFTFAFGDNDLNTLTQFTDTDWHHWAGTFDAATKVRRLYRDGLAVANHVAAAAYQGTGVVWIAHSPWGYGFNGQIDEVRIWSVARTPTEIQAGMVALVTGSEPHLVACWSFDEGAGTTVFDSTGNLLDAALVNEPPWVASTIGRAPTVTTLVASAVFSAATNSTATLNGLVNPNLAPATAWFEWGATTNYGNRTPVIVLDSGMAAIACSSALTDLAAGHTYHYRLVAENSFGMATAGDQRFGTLLIVLNGTNPLTHRAGVAFADPGFGVENPLDLGARAVTAGYYHSLALRSEDSILGWGHNGYAQTAFPCGAVNHVRAIAAGYYHSLALRDDGSVLGWGANAYGEATGVPNSVPPYASTGLVSVAGQALTNIQKIAAGAMHGLGLKPDGSVVGWGNNGNGQATPPTGLTNVVALAAGYSHSLALRAGGLVVGWGNNGNGQITPPAGLTNAVAIAGGYSHSLALKADGSVVGWGNNGNGQAAPPVGLSNAVAIAGGYSHSLALKADGSVVGWGAANYGQATPPPGLSNVVAIAAGYYHSLALRADGSVVGWGYNNYGQTGLNIIVSGGVNTSLPELYTLTYTVTNILGSWARTERTVRIVDVPAVSTLPALNVTSRTVALRSQVSPNGLETFAWFQYGATTNYGSVTPSSQLGDGFAPVPSSLQVTDLISEAGYHYRAVASNSLGVVYGTDAVFAVLSTDADLVALSLSESLPLDRPFDRAVTNYAASVANEMGYLSVTPVSADDGATIRVRANGGDFTGVPSGTASGPLFLDPDANLVEVQVTAQDGVTRKTYAVAVTRAAPSGGLVGPSFPPPLGVGFRESGTANDDQIGRDTGKTWFFSDAGLATETLLFWGATNNGVKLSFDGGTFETNEILIYQRALSSLASGIVVWSGQTLNPTNAHPVCTRFVLSVTNTATGAAIPLIEAASLGLATNIGAVVRVTPGLAWKAVLRFQASFSTNGPFEPALVFFDRQVATNLPAARAYSSFGAGFHHLNTPPALTANGGLTVDRGTATFLTSSLLSAADLESAPALLRFTIAPQGEGGATRNGTLSLSGTNLAAGDFFTQADLNSGRLTYEHRGNCETHDDFTFNVTDQHGSVTPTGEHTTYTFSIAIAQPNVPPVALSGSASTALQGPYQGFLPATNGDCTPQNLTFRLLRLPTRGSVTLDNPNTGAFTYTPYAGQQGVDSFTFQVNDGFVDSFDPGTFTLTIANQRPIAIAGSAATRENVMVNGTLTATDPDRPAQPLTFAIASQGTKGTAVLTNSAPGAFTYTPNRGAIGVDEFTFTAADGTLLSTPATFAVNIRPNLEDGDLVVSDWGAKQLVLIDPTGSQGVVLEGGLLESPRGLAVEPGGAILVMDGVNGLLRVDPGSGSQAVVSANTNFSSAPFGAWGIALEPGGTILVADGVNGLVRVDPATGTPTTLAVSHHILLPVSVALGQSGDVFVGDVAAPLGQSSRLVRVNATSGAQTLLCSGGHLFLPGGIAVEPSGDLLVTEAPTMFGPGLDLLLRVNPTNGNQTVLTSSNLLAGPIGVARGSSGTIYVANMGSGTVVAVDPVTGAQTLFSSGGPLVQPAGIAIVRLQAPHLLVGMHLIAGQVELQFQGLAGHSYTLERSVNLDSWQQVTNATAALDGLARFRDLSPPAGSAFYRVRLP